MQLNNFDIGVFLRDYWQKKPLLIRDPWTSWNNPLEADELAGMACEADIESRLITRTREATGNGWALEHGPFPEERFGQLGKKHWTLLVQAVDHYVPEVSALIEPFRFIPNWRIDDVMVSYAADGGGVGPHFDQYDVFLIQGSGKRRWQTGDHCDENTETLPHDDLRLLANFEARDEWICEPGDILYVPPGIAHNGVALGEDCMTYSIGFRAPSSSELIGYWCDDLLAEMQDDDRYNDKFEDTNPMVRKNPGEISAGEIDRLHKMVTGKMEDRDAFVRWFGQYSSTRKYPDMDWRPEEPMQVEQLRTYVTAGLTLHRNPASRFSFIEQPTDLLLFFADGQCFECARETMAFAQQLCAQDRISIDPELTQSDSTMALIAALFNQGSVTFDQQD